MHDGGFVGAYGEISWYIPKYFVDAHPTSLIPYELKYNTVIRQLLTEGSSEWISKHASSKHAQSTKFDVPDGSQPVIWGSFDSYAMSRYSFNLTRNLFPENGGLDCQFATLGSETALSELISDLYEKQEGFIANIYTPDPNFATNDPRFPAINNDFILQQFEKASKKTFFSRSQKLKEKMFIGLPPKEPRPKRGRSMLFKRRMPESSGTHEKSSEPFTRRTFPRSV